MNRHAYFRQQEKNYLAHHGIKGQKWGIRRYQNPDGSLTPAGKERYGSKIDKPYKEEGHIDTDGGGVKRLKGQDNWFYFYEKNDDYTQKDLKKLWDEIGDGTALREKIVQTEKEIGTKNFNSKDIHKIEELFFNKDNGTYELYADIESNGPAPVVYIYDMDDPNKLTIKGGKFKETYYI